MNSDSKNWLSFIGASGVEVTGKTEADFLDAQMALATPRRLMKILRDITIQKKSPQKKLTEIVSLVAKEMRADVCSCFIVRPGDLLELFSTAGLPVDIARKHRIRMDEGLVGEIASTSFPLVLPEMESYPDYVPRPETGNGAFKSFCGIPILKGGRVRGVLVIQNIIERDFGLDVIDILQTVAMILAELIVSGEFIARQEMDAGFASGESPDQIQGDVMGRGLAIGTAVLYQPGLSVYTVVTDDVGAEKKRLHAALDDMQKSLDRMLRQHKRLKGTESADILEAYQMFARDRGWITKIENAIDKGLSAEAAVESVQNDTRVRMMQIQDDYLRERLEDMEDLSNRLLGHLTDTQKREDAKIDDVDNIILVARSLGPAALLDYDPEKLKAVVLEKGSASNHVAIVARALGVPVVGNCDEIVNFVQTGDRMIVDGDNGMVYIRPSAYVLDLYHRSLETRRKRTDVYQSSAHQKSMTKDGHQIHIMMNAGLPVEVSQMNAVGAEGVGLYRTELSFMALKKYPLVSTQVEMYTHILDTVGDKPVVFRTLDIGGDKPLPYFRPADEENPALGWRAVRIGLDRPAILRTQFRAFIRASKGRPIKIMVPFVTEVAEFDRARALLKMEITRAKEQGWETPAKIDFGLMLEVPSLIWQLDALLETADFISVGTNDLMQYMYATDRGNGSLRGRYDALSPPLLNALKMIVEKCNAANVPVSICGEMAGLPLEAMVLIALGYRSLSMPPQSVEAVKTMIPALDTAPLKAYLEKILTLRDHSLRERLQSFARDHQIHMMVED